MYDIQLTATANNWRLFMLRKADSAFLSFREKIHSRDNYTCQFCGFRANQNLEIINLDGNYLNNKYHNLLTACGLCAQCFFLEAIGRSDFGGGVLVYLPEMHQTELNALCHVLFATMVLRLKNVSYVKNIYRNLKLRAQIVEEKLGDGLSNPALFGQMLIDSPVKNTTHFKKITDQFIRLLPSISSFANETLEWSQESLKMFEI